MVPIYIIYNFTAWHGCLFTSGGPWLHVLPQNTLPLFPICGSLHPHLQGLSDLVDSSHTGTVNHPCSHQEAGCKAQVSLVFLNMVLALVSSPRVLHGPWRIQDHLRNHSGALHLSSLPVHSCSCVKSCNGCHHLDQTSHVLLAAPICCHHGLPFLLSRYSNYCYA